MGLFDFFKKNSVSLTGYDARATSYRLDTLEQIQSIPVPTRKFEYNCDFTESIEYVLQRKATQFKKEGKLDLAIACLRKSNEIMPYAPMMYSPKDYARLEEYLKLARNFDSARQESGKDKILYEKQESFHKQARLKEMFTTGVIQVSRGDFICGECAKYHARIYSQNCSYGFPDINIFASYYMNKPCDCILTFYSFWIEASQVTICSPKDAVVYSNRPFVDDRTNLEKAQYNKRITKAQEDQKDRADYAWLCEHFPDVAPKSFGGYRNMKNKNSENYKKLVAKAKEFDYTI